MTRRRPGGTHTFDSSELLTAESVVRRDQGVRLATQRFDVPAGERTHTNGTVGAVVR